MKLNAKYATLLICFISVFRLLFVCNAETSISNNITLDSAINTSYQPPEWITEFLIGDNQTWKELEIILITRGYYSIDAESYEGALIKHLLNISDSADYKYMITKIKPFNEYTKYIIARINVNTDKVEYYFRGYIKNPPLIFFDTKSQK